MKQGRILDIVLRAAATNRPHHFIITTDREAKNHICLYVGRNGNE